MSVQDSKSLFPVAARARGDKLFRDWQLLIDNGLAKQVCRIRQPIPQR